MSEVSGAVLVLVIEDDGIPPVPEVPARVRGLVGWFARLHGLDPAIAVALASWAWQAGVPAGMRLAADELAARDRIARAEHQRLIDQSYRYSPAGIPEPQPEPAPIVLVDRTGGPAGGGTSGGLGIGPADDRCPECGAVLYDTGCPGVAGCTAASCTVCGYGSQYETTGCGRCPVRATDPAGRESYR